MFEAVGGKNQWIFCQGQCVKQEEFQFYGIGLRWVLLEATIIDEGDFFKCAVGVEVQGAIGQALDEFAAEQMDCRAAGAVAQLPGSIAFIEQFFGHITVFDDDGTIIQLAEMSEFFQRVSFNQGPAAHFRAGQIVHADKQRINEFHQGVVYLPVGQNGHPAALHIIECTGVEQGGKTASVAIGGKGKAVRSSEDGFAFEIKGGQGALGEKHQVFRGESEIFLLCEEFVCGLVIGGTGHDIPGQSTGKFFLIAQDGFGKELKQGGVSDGSELKSSFGAVITQAGTLSAGDGEPGKFSAIQQLDAPFPAGFLICPSGSGCRFQRRVWCRLQLIKGNGEIIVLQCGFCPAHRFCPVDVAYLPGQIFLLPSSQRLPESEQVRLPERFQQAKQLFFIDCMHKQSEFWVKGYYIGRKCVLFVAIKIAQKRQLDNRERLKMRFEDHYQALVSKILPVIAAELEAQGRLLPLHLREVTGSYLIRPGKCLRPVLLLLCCEAAGGDADMALPAAAAVELFHTWTLLHDDVIDHDSLRRGQETGHIRGARLGREDFQLSDKHAADYGQSLAILAGDVLQGEVVHLLSTAVEIHAEKRLSLLAGLSSRLNPELLAGEQLDVEMACRPLESISEAEILEMMRLKTGVLLGYCAEAGAIIGSSKDSNRELSEALRQFAESCGIAFQLQDDILGITGTEEVLGKNIGSDLREGKRTLLLIKACKQCTDAQRAELASVLGNEHAGADELAQATRIIIESGALQQTFELAGQYQQSALDILQKALPDGPGRDHLQSWAALIIKRNR